MALGPRSASERHALTPLDDVRDAIVSRVSALKECDVALEHLHGCVLVTDFRAVVANPRFDNSAMAGFAVRSADVGDLPVRLRVVEQILAGRASARSIGSGEAARIMTGAPMPEGADAVVKIEDAEVDDGSATVTLHGPVARGQHVRYASEDVHVGDVVVSAGRRLGPIDVGVLASQGVTTLSARPRPVVGVISTGDELVQGGPLASGQIFDTNRPMMLALLEQWGYEAVDAGGVADDEDAIVARLDATIARCDAVITTGGVSVGDADHVMLALRRLCPVSAVGLRVAIKPGKPMSFAVTDEGVPIFSLAGNPLAAVSLFHLVVRPALARRAGLAAAKARLVARLDVALSRRVDGRTHVVPARVTVDSEARLRVEAAWEAESHRLRSAALANALVLVPDGPGLRAGDLVEIELTGGLVAGGRESE